MNKLLYLKKGFSLVEIAIILVVIGVLFIAASSIIQGRSSSLEVTRTENRLQQIRDIIMGAAKYTGFVPADSQAEALIRKEPINIGVNTRLFSESVTMLDGYGNPFQYKHGAGQHKFYESEGDAPHGTSDLCNNKDANMTVDFHTPSMSKVNNVAYIVYSYGKNGTKEIDITSSPSDLFGENLTIHIPISSPGFDDKFQFLTLDQIQKELQCPKNDTNPLEIYTKTLAMKPAGSGQVDTQPRNPSAPIVTRNIIYSSSSKAKWCIEVADPAISQEKATKQIEAFRLTTEETYINANEIPPVPVKANGGCTELSSFTASHNNSASLQIVLNSDLTKLAPGEYYYNVHMYDYAEPSNRIKQLVKINVPNP